MMEVGIRNRSGAHDHASVIKLGEIRVTHRVQGKGVAAGPKAKDDSRAGDAVRNDRGVGPLNPGLDREVLQLQTRRGGDGAPITAAVEHKRLADPTRTRSR